MKDTVIKGTGNSRYLKSVANFKSLYPTYDAFVEALVAGTLPIDFNGVNPDGMTQLGTPLSMSSLLKHTTAALFELGEEAVPDDVLHALGRFRSGIGNEHIWAKYADGQVAYIAESTTLTTVRTATTGEVTVGRRVKIENGAVVLDDITTVGVDFLTGNYMSYEGAIYRIVADTAVTETYYEYVGYAQSVAYAAGVVGYVNSPNPNTYPPSVDDGFTYEYLGQLGHKTRVKVGSYTGTGTYGNNSISTKNRLTFDFKPSLVIVFSPGYGGYILVLPPVSGNVARSESNGYKTSVEWSGNTVYWHSAQNAFEQLNERGYVFYYIAIG